MNTPRVLSEQACAISMSGSVVTIDCDMRAEAEEVFEWLCGYPSAPIMSVSEETFERVVALCETPPPPSEALIVMLRLARAAQGIEARQGGDGEAGSVHESPVAEGDAP
jgi:hypothetical protein